MSPNARKGAMLLAEDERRRHEEERQMAAADTLSNVVNLPPRLGSVRVHRLVNQAKRKESMSLLFDLFFLFLFRFALFFGANLL